MIAGLSDGPLWLAGLSAAVALGWTLRYLTERSRRGGMLDHSHRTARGALSYLDDNQLAVGPRDDLGRRRIGT